MRVCVCVMKQASVGACLQYFFVIFFFNIFPLPPCFPLKGRSFFVAAHLLFFFIVPFHPIHPTSTLHRLHNPILQFDSSFSSAFQSVTTLQKKLTKALPVVSLLFFVLVVEILHLGSTRSEVFWRLLMLKLMLILCMNAVCCLSRARCRN